MSRIPVSDLCPDCYIDLMSGIDLTIDEVKLLYNLCDWDHAPNASVYDIMCKLRNFCPDDE